MLPSFANDTLTVEEPVWVEERGKRTRTYPGTNVVTVEGCSVQPGAVSTELSLRDNTQILVTAFLPAGTVVSRFAKIVYETDEYSIDGIPQRWKSPLGTVDHIVLPLIAWEG